MNIRCPLCCSTNWYYNKIESDSSTTDHLGKGSQAGIAQLSCDLPHKGFHTVKHTTSSSSINYEVSKIVSKAPWNAIFFQGCIPAVLPNVSDIQPHEEFSWALTVRPNGYYSVVSQLSQRAVATCWIKIITIAPHNQRITG
jgi:hypothetical protein